MAIDVLPFTASYRDAKGFVGRIRFHVSTDSASGTVVADTDTVISAVLAAANNLTNAALASFAGFRIAAQPTLTYGTNAEYPAEWMKAVMTFSTDLGTIHRFRIPAPKIALFDTDGVTILNDGTQAAVVAYVAAMKTAVNSAFVCSPGGQPLTHFVGGILRLGKQPRRFNEFIKSSHLVAGEGE
jgi:hypothetical protein